MIIDNNEIILRPRFKIEVSQSQNTLIEKFKELKKLDNNVFISRVRHNYVLLDIPEDRNKFWSPQLELSIEQLDGNKAEINCLFGPKGIVWTFFMFLHFICASVFTLFFVVGYSNWSLNKPYGWSLTICIAMIVVWFTFYFLGRIGKRLAKNQMQELHQFVKEVLKN